MTLLNLSWLVDRNLLHSHIPDIGQEQYFPSTFPHLSPEVITFQESSIWSFLCCSSWRITYMMCAPQNGGYATKEDIDFLKMLRIRLWVVLGCVLGKQTDWRKCARDLPCREVGRKLNPKLWNDRRYQHASAITNDYQRLVQISKNVNVSTKRMGCMTQLYDLDTTT